MNIRTFVFGSLLLLLPSLAAANPADFYSSFADSLHGPAEQRRAAEQSRLSAVSRQKKIISDLRDPVIALTEHVAKVCSNQQGSAGTSSIVCSKAGFGLLQHHGATLLVEDGRLKGYSRTSGAAGCTITPMIDALYVRISNGEDFVSLRLDSKQQVFFVGGKIGGLAGADLAQSLEKGYSHPSEHKDHLMYASSRLGLVQDVCGVAALAKEFVR